MSNVSQHQARNYRTQVLPVVGGSETIEPTSAELGFLFVNHLHRSVTVINRLGARIVIPYRPMPKVTVRSKKSGPLDHRPCFIIRSRVHASSDVNLDTSELSNDLGHSTSIEAQALLDSVQFMEDRLPRGLTQTACVEYRIPSEDFDANGGVLFLQNLDLQVSILDQASTGPHPFSLLGQRNRDAFEFKEKLAPKGVFYGVYIRDRDHTHGNRFININGVVYGVPILEEESSERDGVYCITSGRTTSALQNERILTEYYTFEEADVKLGLYETYRDALTLGNPQERFKREYDERLQILRNDELAFKEERAATDRVLELERDRNRAGLLEYEHQLRRIEQLNKLTSAELERRDQNYRRESQILKEIMDTRGHERRESTEILKLIPTLITTVAAYVAAYKKIKSL